jgi:DNA (cytosine-5)-methyltransferase 1
MKFADLFCGIGGFRLGFESVGAECTFGSDIDQYACATYESNFGDHPLSDIKKIQATKLPHFDLLCAGFPCQPFSIGGYRKGFQDTRGTLFFDIERIIREKKPKAFILENVKGIVNHAQGRTMQIILNKLAKNVNGNQNFKRFEDCLNYDVYYSLINSRNYGVPQNRERIYIVGFSRPCNFKMPDCGDKKYLTDIIETNIPENTLSPIVNQHITRHHKAHKKYNEIKDFDHLLTYEVRKCRSTFRYDNLSPTLTAKMGTGGNNVPILVNKRRKLTVRECLRIQGFPETFNMKENYSQSYKQIGNSVSVPVIKALAKEIMSVM